MQYYSRSLPETRPPGHGNDRLTPDEKLSFRSMQTTRFLGVKKGYRREAVDGGNPLPDRRDLPGAGRRQFPYGPITILIPWNLVLHVRKFHEDDQCPDAVCPASPHVRRPGKCYRGVNKETEQTCSIYDAFHDPPFRYSPTAGCIVDSISPCVWLSHAVALARDASTKPQVERTPAKMRPGTDTQ